MTESLADRIRQAREDAGLSQGRAAELIGVKQPQLSRWERGVNRPSVATLTKMASVYRVNVSALAGEGRSVQLPTTSPQKAAEQFVRISRDAAMFWRGRLVEQVHTLRGVGESMQSLLRMLERATDGVETFNKSGILPLTEAEQLAADIEAAEARGKKRPKRDDEGDERAAGGSG